MTGKRLQINNYARYFFHTNDFDFVLLQSTDQGFA